jgi:hypothetical protein
MSDGDLDRMMALWADDDGAVCNHPGGPRLLGLQAIRESFSSIFSSGGVRIATAQRQAWSTPDIAVHSLIEHIAVEGRAGTEVIEVVATNIFVRSPKGWRILVHHAGVSESADDGDVDFDDDDDEDGDQVHPLLHRGWSPGLPGNPRRADDAEGGDEAGEGDDSATQAGDPMRPPPGRLH